MFLGTLFFLLLTYSADVSQAAGDGIRQTLMEQEMDCITRNFQNGGGVPWQNTCSSEYSSYSSGRYDVAKSNKKDTDYYGTTSPASYKPKNDAPIRNTDYRYSKYASDDKDSYDSIDMRYAYGDDVDSDSFFEANVRLLAGYREDDFDWNIASDITGNATPNILSELTWSNLKMTQLKAEGDIILDQRFIFDGMVSYADIYEGDNQDSDYLGNDRTLEFSRSNNNSSDGQAFDWSLAVGYRIFIGSEDEFFVADNMALTFLGGYSSHKLDLIITEGFQTIPATGPFGPTLHSSYWAEWDGPWVGFKLEGKKDRILGAFRFEYHWADYYGSANWNLRTDFQHPKSYEHIADGTGLVFNLGVGYRMTDNLTMNLRADIQDWKAKNGIDRTFFSNGTILETRLNEVNWQSKAFMLGSTYKF